MATLLFAVVQRFAPSSYDRTSHPAAATWWPLLSKCTFGIYLSQMVILREVIWPLTPWLARTHWVVEIDDGIKPVCFYKTKNGFEIAPFFDTARARKNRKEEEGDEGKT